MARLCYLVRPLADLCQRTEAEMEVGIMGLAASGKSTVFGLLTGQETTSARRDAARVGIARVPDARLGALSAMYEPEKTTPATVRYVDVPGIPEEHRQGEAAFNLPELRSADALMVVLRARKLRSSEVRLPPLWPAILARRRRRLKNNRRWVGVVAMRTIDVWRRM